MTLNHVDKGYAVRPIGLDIETYATGLLAADRLPLRGRQGNPRALCYVFLTFT
jgi:hypothetical protein